MSIKIILVRRLDMRHQDVFKSIDDFVFLGKELEKEVEAHILSCEKCRRYFENSKRFLRGLKELKSIASTVGDSVSIDISHKSRFSWILVEIKKRVIRRIVLSLLGVSMVFLIGIVFLFYLNSSYISEELVRELILMEEHVSYIYSFDEVDIGY